MLRASRRGFTLVELLVVIAIIGILMGLLMPAVQSARESARRLQCTNNVRNLALGAIQHTQANGYFPSGGWGWRWSGDPNRGFGKTQPGGWGYSILPYIEQQSLHDMGMGQSDAVRRAEGAKMCAVPLAVTNCPTRRPLKVRPYVHGTPYQNIDKPPGSGRGDYAASAGDGGQDTNGMFDPEGPSNYDGAPGFTTSTNENGVLAVKSQYTRASVKDGTSNTYLIGERYLSATDYESGTASDDDQNFYLGFDRDTVRFASLSGDPPMRDRPGYASWWIFGSAHSNGFAMSMCDGSVRTIQYSIDRETHRRLGNRKDNLPIDGSKL